MPLIQDLTFAALDFESAGDAPGLTDAPVQAGIAHMHGSEIQAAGFFRTYINPKRTVAWAAQKVHGITTAHLTDAPEMMALWPEFRSRLSGHVIVAHGAGTEKRFLRAFPLHGFGPWLDTVQLSRRAWPGLGDYSLESLAVRLGFRQELDALCPGVTFHDALYDAAGSLLILRTLINGAGLLKRDARELLEP